jgi:hypothetical protein
LPKQFGKERVKLGDFDLVLAAANLHDYETFSIVASRR